ncbi:hypothetical protein EDB92DRAFT_1839852 [Lactarius akahatsu]|uniref:MIT domain-containing protein n=1 Tax=Lactarius akahatsu TaxID=416441 RepID=A0AAD4LP10_9AGAM|nr:hypothetical protein EDB92DRAFT_1839852 [Lactarius akahatsu]
MQFGIPRQPSVLTQSTNSDWDSFHPQHDAGPSNSVSPSSYISTSLAQRRRSSALHPPPQPPPSQPIPSVPIPPDTTPISSSDGSSFMDDDPPMTPAGMIQNFARPVASPRLSSVAAFSQAQVRHTSSAVAPLPSTNGVRSPPRQRPHSPPVQHQEIVPERLLISSRDPQQSSERSRPSSRRALTKALELAREAVKLDSTNDDPYGAVVAYGKSVALLSKVMERVMSGEDSTDSIRRRGGRRRSVVAQEEEVRRLKAIHDTYADRMNILSLIYSIPPPPHSPSPLYPTSISTSTDSTQPPSPVSGSPSSDSSDHLHREPSTAQLDEVDVRRFSQDTAKYELFEGGVPSELETSGYHHPYSAASVPQSFDDDPETPIARATVVAPNGKRSTAPPPARPQPPSPPPPGPSSGLRPRATSDLPPPAPPPHSALPPAPHQPISSRHLNATRPRGQSISHSRSGSNSRLEPLQEERDKQPEQAQQRVQPNVDDDLRHQPRSTQLDAARSQPLPPLPLADSLTVSEPAQDRSPTSLKFGPRPRGGSTFSTRSEIISPPTLISNSTTMGTISQRRSKASAPPSTSTSTLIQSPDAVLPLSLKPKVPSLMTSVPPPSYARSRASSQPGQRPSLTGLPSLSYDASARPPSAVAVLPRKTSVSSKSNSSLPQITVVTGYLSPPLDTPANQLVPPPPIPHSNLPTTPTSPLPPTAPSDPLRKPYHMMSLLRHTMISKTGGYITPKLHVPQEVWSQGGARLLNLPEKVRVVEVLCSSLEEVQHSSGGVFGAGNVSASLAPGIGKKEGELWSLKLEEFSNVCDGVVANFGKKLGVGEGFMIKKHSGVTSWGGKLTRQLDKLTNQKNLDSPASYVQGLSRLFAQVQLLDEHSRAVSMQPIAPAYASLTPELRSAIESKLRRSSEFFATVVLTFVVRDMAQLLDKYVKKCEKWLAE